MRGTRGMGEMLYSRECRKTFREMSPNIPWNVVKHSSNILHALNSQIQFILAYVSILYQKLNYLNSVFINESKVFQIWISI